MNKFQTNDSNEMDLRELFYSLWRGKIYIFFFAFLFVFLASLYLQDHKKLFLVEYKLKAVAAPDNNNGGVNLRGLSGLATLSGVPLPANNNTDFMIFKELLYSVEVSEEIFKNKELIKRIYSNEWNSSFNNFIEPSKSEFRAYISNLKNIVTGSKKAIYIPPNPRRLAVYISSAIKVDEDQDTGFLNVKAETTKPDMLLSVITLAVETADHIMRQRYINFSAEPLAFYKEKLRTARSREHREALAGLISKEEQKLMFASKGKYFTAEPYIAPSISLYPVAPRPILILFFSMIFGFFIGCCVALMRSEIMKVRK